MLLNRHNDNFLKELSADPQETAQALRLLLSFFRDVVLLKGGVSKTELVHQDCLQEIEKFAARGFEELTLIIRQIIQTKEARGRKVERQNVLEPLEGTYMGQLVQVKLGEYRPVVWVDANDVAVHRHDMVILEIERNLEFGKVISDHG